MRIRTIEHERSCMHFLAFFFNLKITDMCLLDVPLNDGSLHPKDPSSCFAHLHADSSLWKCRLLYGNIFFSFAGKIIKMLPAFKEKWRVYKPGLAQVMVVAKKKKKSWKIG